MANYVFNQFIGTFTLLNVPGSTVVAQGFQDDNSYGNIPIGFSFLYNNTTYTSVGVSTNGWITFGSYFPNDNFAPISNSGGNGDGVVFDWSPASGADPCFHLHRQNNSTLSTP